MLRALDARDIGAEEVQRRLGLFPELDEKIQNEIDAAFRALRSRAS
jgi:hypothetical protein